MVYYFTLRYLAFLIIAPVVYARSHKYSLTGSSSVRYTDVLAYYEKTSTMQCLALCDGTDMCTSVNHNLDTEKCELTPHVPRTQTPASAAEPNWRVYYSDRIIPAVQAWQKSTFIRDNKQLSADYAIDGDRDNKIGQYLPCANTAEHYSYWAMEFQYVAEVEYVMIYFLDYYAVYNYRNRDLRLIISTTRQECDDDIGTECAYFVGPPALPNQPIKITCTQPVTGKFLKIIHEYNDQLVLCEVEVYSVEM